MPRVLSLENKSSMWSKVESQVIGFFDKEAEMVHHLQYDALVIMAQIDKSEVFRIKVKMVVRSKLSTEMLSVN